jgi:hypothetical protein
VRVRPHDEPDRLLMLSYEDVEQPGAATRVPLRKGADGWWEAELGPLPEGVYRVSALGDSVEPVTDLVTVIGE